MVHATTGIVRAVHTDWPLISSIIHVHHDGLLAGKLMKQLINKCFYIKYATQIAGRKQKAAS